MNSSKSDFHASSPVSKIKVGEFVRLSPGGAVWIRGAYDRAAKKYPLQSFAAVGTEKLVSPGRVVFHGFTF